MPSACNLDQVFPELDWIERFPEIGMRAELPEVFLFFIVTGAADDNDRNVGVNSATPKVGEQLETIQTGHYCVGDNHIGHQSLAEVAHGLEAVFCARHSEMF